MRLDKFLSDAVGITRSKAKSAILAGRVCIDSTIFKDCKKQVDPDNDCVTLDGVKIVYSQYKYIMLNKPKGVVCANNDSHHKTVFDLIDDPALKKDMFVCGRLDRDTTDFVLVTNNGPLAHMLLSPKNHVSKVYEVTLENGDMKGYDTAFAQGIVLNDGFICRPANFKKIDEKICLVELVEGKFHQVKRMFEVMGNKVNSLKRISFAGIELDKELKEGEFRTLNDFEKEKLLAKRTKK